MTSKAIHSSLLAACALVAIVAGALQTLAAPPEPSIVPRDWQLDITYQHPRPIAIRDVEGNTRWYWYLTYRVVNNSGQERFFSPEITIATDKGDIVVANDKIPGAVYDAIAKKLNNPLLENPLTVTGKILIGEDYARNSVAIWPAFDHDVDSVHIFFAGLSGETATIEHPETGETVVLRKTLQIDYATPGTEEHPQRQPVEHKGSRWIMR